MKKNLTISFVFITIFILLGISRGNTDNMVLQKLWEYPVLMGGFWVIDPSPAIGNLRGDAALEVVFGTADQFVPDAIWGSGGRYVCLSSTGQLLWNGATPDDWAQASPAIADLDGDGKREVVGASCSGHWVIAYDGVTGNQKWKFGPYTEFKASPALADVHPGYPGPEIVIANQGFGPPVDPNIREGGAVFCISSSGEMIWAFFPGDVENFTATPAVADVDADGLFEVIAISDQGEVYCLSAMEGRLKWTYTVPDEAGDFLIIGTYDRYFPAVVISSPALADVDVDPFREVIFGAVSGRLYCLDGQAGSLQWTYGTDGPIASSPAIGDVDGDENYEIVFGSGDGKVYCLKGDGGLIWTYATGRPVNGSPGLAQRTNNGAPYRMEWPMFRQNPARTGLYLSERGCTLDIYIGSDDGYLYMLSGNRGELIDRFNAVAPVNCSPAIGDMDGDGTLEVLFKDTGVTLYALREESTVPEIHVPGNYPTIQAAIDAANNGDVIVVHPGIYDEHIHINVSEKAVTIRSTNPYDPAVVAATVIEGSQDWGNSLVTFESVNTGVVNTGVISKFMGFTVQNGKGDYMGGIYCQGASPIISNCIIRGNGGDGGDGGIYICCGASPKIMDCIIMENKAENGGGISCNSGTAPVISHCLFVKNEANENGGGIHSEYLSFPIIRNCIFYKNRAQKGGGICCFESSPSIANTIFWENGSEIYAGSHANPKVCYSDIQGGYQGLGNIQEPPRFIDPNNGNFYLETGSNRSPCIDSGHPRIYDKDGTCSDMGIYGGKGGQDPLSCTIKVAPGNGSGGFTSIQHAIDYAMDGDIIAVSPGTYQENLIINGKNISIISEQNAAPVIIDGTDSGSVMVFANGGRSTLLKGLTLQNGSSEAGGGIDCMHASPMITDCIIQDNLCIHSGGGILCMDSSPVITNCLIRRNMAGEAGSYGGYGGGMHCRYASFPTIRNCTFSANAAISNGGGIDCDVDSATIMTNCIISENSTQKGGGLFVSGESMGGDKPNPVTILTNCTITNNYASQDGGSIYFEESWGVLPPVLTNCILWGNKPNEIAGSADLTVTYSDIRNGYEGKGNISDDPQFVNPEEGIYYLEPNSPCIDAGTREGAPNTDKEGIPRPVNLGFDMGAYEFLTCSPESLMAQYQDADRDGFGDPHFISYYLYMLKNFVGNNEDCDDHDPNINPFAIEICDGFDNNCDGYIDEGFSKDIYYLDCDGDGYGDANNPVESCFQPEGYSAEGTDCMDTNKKIHPGAIEQCDGFDNNCNGHTDEGCPPFLLVDDDCPVSPPGNCYRRIQEAVNAAGEGDLIVVRTGNYREQVVINKAITLQGTDPDDPLVIANTIIDGGKKNSVIRFNVEGGNDVVLSGISVRNGYSSSGAGISCYQSSPTIKKCFIIGNEARNLGGGIYCNESSPFISNCIIAKNSANVGGGISCDKISFPIIENCTIIDNSARLTKDSVNYGGGIYCYDNSSPYILNSILWGNTSAFYTEDHSYPRLSYCNVQDGFEGLGNIIEEPLFLDPENEDYHLNPNSPCIDKGHPRIYDGDNTRSDMGAYGGYGGSDPNGIHIIVSPDHSGDFSSIQQSFDYAVSGDTIMISPGTYNGNLVMGRKDVSISAQSSNEKPVIDGSSSGPAIVLIQMGSGSRLEGIMIQNGNGKKGGGILCVSSSPTITDCIIRGNWAYSGGGIYCSFSSPNITHCTIEENNVSHSGGGICCDHSSPAITHCRIRENITHSSAGYGAGVCCFFSSPLVSHCLITGNTLKSPEFGRGGGIYCQGSSPRITHCVISRNILDRGNAKGGGIYSASSSPTLINCIISENELKHPNNVSGGGIYCTDSSPTLMNCTISKNVLRDPNGLGGGIYCHSSSPLITNSILWGDTNDEIYENGDCNLIVTFSDIQGGYSGGQNIDADPLFFDPNAGDFRLLFGSPCIDSGTSEGAPTEDTDGISRPHDGDNNGIALFDMGAYEYMDQTPPYLGDHDPDPNASQVPPDTSIQFTIIDVDKGVNPDSIMVRVNGQEVVSSAVITPIDRGYLIVYKPIESFEHGKTVHISVEAKDLASPPNEMLEAFSFTIVSSVQLDLPEGWSMISLPALPQSLIASNVFPDAIVIYSYTKGYGYIRVKGNEELEAGKGYWILLPEAKSYTITGDPIEAYTLSVKNGWMMIGACSGPATSKIDTGSITVIYRFELGSGYVRVLSSETLQPGKGYWILFAGITDQAELLVKCR